MKFMEWLLAQRQHPEIGRFAVWAWSEHSKIPRTADRLSQALVHCPDEWRTMCKDAHRLYRRERAA